MSTTIFHSGEVAAQVLAGVATPHAAIRDWMPDQHRSFFGALPFLPIATAGQGGSPVATILTGTPGFVSSPDPTTLRIGALPDPEDPAAIWLAPGASIGILGIDLATRRRNRANGMLQAVDRNGLTVSVSQSFGNCPRYIQTRRWHAASARPGRVTHLSDLDAAARATVAAADTAFVASGTAGAGLDISHRGGPPGFIAVADDTLTIPDFPGNHYFNTFGNLLLDPHAALLFIDWSDGSLLHLQGEAEMVWAAPPRRRETEPRAERLWRFSVAGGWRRPGALPLRWSRDGGSGAEG
jgi:predicted pyridoxine 5'-phosphate oxidase superfamily flavin-nucleotide-binding protein